MNTNIWDYFDRKVCLTLDNNRTNGKPSRWPKFADECKRVGLSNVEKFIALPGIGPHQSFTLSQKKMLTDFVESGAKRLITFEDDCYFCDLEPLKDAIYDIKRNNIYWNVLYLGGNIQGSAIKVRRNLFAVKNVWTTHAVAYTRTAAIALLAKFPNENEIMYDTYLGTRLVELNALMVSPMVAFQRPDYSDIWKNDVDYTNIFKESQRKMRL